MPIKFIPIPVLTEQQIASFHQKYDVLLPGGCWEWKACRTQHGYGRVGIRGMRYIATRIGYYLFYGEDPGSLEVTHKCNNPPCMNPLHFELGTHGDNMSYAAKCGRICMQTKPWLARKGTDHWNCRFTDEQVFDMHTYLSNGLKIGQIAKIYNVKYAVIWKIVTGRRRKISHRSFLEESAKTE